MKSKTKDILTVQKLLIKRLKMLRITTNKTALSFALNPTTTMTQATNPSILTITLVILHSPENTNPINKKIRRTLPASWKYILRSFSSSWGRPANANRLRFHESERTMRRPPMTERLRRKKFRSKIRPYPSAWVTTTARRPPTAYSEWRRAITRVEQANIATTLRKRNVCVRPQGTMIDDVLDVIP